MSVVAGRARSRRSPCGHSLRNFAAFSLRVPVGKKTKYCIPVRVVHGITTADDRAAMLDVEVNNASRDRIALPFQSHLLMAAVLTSAPKPMRSLEPRYVEMLDYSRAEAVMPEDIERLEFEFGVELGYGMTWWRVPVERTDGHWFVSSLTILRSVTNWLSNRRSTHLTGLAPHVFAAEVTSEPYLHTISLLSETSASSSAITDTEAMNFLMSAHTNWGTTFCRVRSEALAGKLHVQPPPAKVRLQATGIKSSDGNVLALQPIEYNVVRAPIADGFVFLQQAPYGSILVGEAPRRAFALIDGCKYTFNNFEAMELIGRPSGVLRDLLDEWKEHATMSGTSYEVKPAEHLIWRG